MSNPFEQEGYRAINKARLDHLESLGLPLENKTVLEVGAGIGDHTMFYVDRGCKVTVTDGREENVNFLHDRFEMRENVTVALLDLEDPPEKMPTKQIVHCYGLLYHLRDPAEALAILSLCCDEMLLVETCVSHNDESHSVNEDPADVRNAVHGKGCRPSRAFIRGCLKNHFPYVYMPITQPNHPDFPTNWEHLETKNLTRAVFVASRKPLHSSELTEGFPFNQLRMESHDRTA